MQASVGEVFDVAVDLRKNSPTFGQWAGVVLSAENNRQLWVPAGFWHAFLVTSDVAEVQYNVDAYWSPGHERSLRWDGLEVGIEWPAIPSISISGKDERADDLGTLRQSGDLFD